MARPTTTDVHPNNNALTNISIAYKNDVYIAEQVFPVVTVQKKSDFYFVFDKSSWFRNRSGMRAPGTRAPRADYGISTASYVCVNDALAKPIPDEVRDNADAPLQPDIEATEFVTDGLLLGQEIRVANIITSSTQWAYDSAAGTQWTSDTSDPWNDINTAKKAVVQTIGRMPNVAVCSYATWAALENHPDFLERIKYTRATGKVEPGDLKGWFGFDKVLIGTPLKDIAQEGVTASMTFVWDDDFWCGYVSPTPSLRTPSAGYILRWGSRKLSTFREEQEHQDVVEIEMFTSEVVTASDAGANIYNCV